jgi:hypothetical protein
MGVQDLKGIIQQHIYGGNQWRGVYRLELSTEYLERFYLSMW